ncbi:HAUS augmin-like complex subunit 5 [Discoglossus pictus]
MERKTLAQELKRWAVEEMGLTAQKAPSEDTLQRLFIGQCADIWKYIIRHVHSQRNVRKIEGNLLWYQQLQRSEAQRSAEEQEQQRRKKLCKEILELRSELQHLQEQIHSAEREIVNQDLSSVKAHDFCRRSMLLQAFNRKREQEYAALNESNLKIQYRCEQLRGLKRASQREVTFSNLDREAAAAQGLESDVLRDVRAVCQVRFQFLQSLHDDTVTGAMRAVGTDMRSLSHQQWMNVAEKVWTLHPPNHVLAALEHLSVDTANRLRELQSDVEDDPFDSSFDDSAEYDIHDPNDLCDTSRNTGSSSENDFVLPSFKTLIQEGWAETVRISTQLRFMQNRTYGVSERLAQLVQEVHKNLSDGSELSELNRAAFDMELQLMILRGTRDALVHEYRLLQHQSTGNRVEVKLLEQQKMNINQTQLILKRKQEQIQVLISGNINCKKQIKANTVEAQKYLRDMLHPRPQEVIKESQKFQDSLVKEVKHFSAISLPGLLRVCTDGMWVPVQDLSINRLSNTHCPYYDIFRGIYDSIGLPLYKAPEATLSHVADMKRQMFLLQSQLRSRSHVIKKLHRRLRENQNPDTDTLLQQLSSHYSQQIDQLVPKLQHLTEQCEKSQEYWKEVQATVTDWWEQPAQMGLPWEQREGLTLRQWRDRWTVAATALQTASGNWS